MELGNKIKQLRNKASLTQEQLADELGISAQSVSKWETGASMPDITLLPKIAERFGVSIDELFDLTVEQKLNRIDNRLDFEDELTHDVFWDYEEFLKAQLANEQYKYRATSLLAHLYWHSIDAMSKKAAKYAKEAILLAPEKKDCQWIFEEAAGGVCWDWNIENHAKIIDFYKEVIASDKIEPHTPLPYYYLIDHLIADNRLDEAEKYVAEVAKLPATKPVLLQVYKAYIALGRHDVKTADEIMNNLVKD
ncbi:MAG: helix-turn-helix transcriptional regulator, partial [Clostridia bacterium]|nr:helix-turn-helix transcriptional regulator [Clostridia bacterium]